MSDIVERLRNYADPSKTTDCRDTDDMCLQAATEIERLRTECDTLKACGGGAFKDEASRKRGRDEPAQGGGGADDIWATFQFDMSKV